MSSMSKTRYFTSDGIGAPLSLVFRKRQERKGASTPSSQSIHGRDATYWKQNTFGDNGEAERQALRFPHNFRTPILFVKFFTRTCVLEKCHNERTVSGRPGCGSISSAEPLHFRSELRSNCIRLVFWQPACHVRNHLLPHADILVGEGHCLRGTKGFQQPAEPSAKRLGVGCRLRCRRGHAAVCEEVTLGIDAHSDRSVIWRGARGHPDSESRQAH